MTRIIQGLGLSVLLLAGGLTGGETGSAAARSDWAEIQAVLAATQVKDGKTDPYAQFVATARQRDALHVRLKNFLRDHPADEHRAEAIFQLLMRPPARLLEVDPARFAREGPAAAVYDTAAVAAWEQEAQRTKAAFLADPATRPEWRQDIRRRDIYLDARAACERLQRGEKTDLTPLRAQLDAWLGDFPLSDRVAVPVESYMRAVALAAPDSLETEWDRFAQSPNPVLQELAQGQLLVCRARRFPLDWRFTALDGRPVDLTKLRGRLVLIDFWATWCMPCLAEMPELKRLHARYHDRGFEIVGVSLDSAGDRRKLEQLVAAHGMPWPQHFDGAGRRNAYAVRYGIKSIPVKLLLDEEGRLIQPRISLADLRAELERRFGP